MLPELITVTGLLSTGSCCLHVVAQGVRILQICQLFFIQHSNAINFLDFDLCTDVT